MACRTECGLVRSLAVLQLLIHLSQKGVVVKVRQCRMTSCGYMAAQPRVVAKLPVCDEHLHDSR
jgi:hypothetical protein